MGDNCPFTFDENDFDFDGCNVTEVIKFLQILAETPNASEINVAFTKHITNAIMQIREEKLKYEASIPKKLEDGWEPIIRMNVDDFDCNALCDLGASISVMPSKIYDMLDLPPLEKCYLDVHPVEIAAKKPLGRVNNVLIKLIITLSLLILLSWILNAMLHAPLYWEDLFLELQVPSLI